MPVIRPKIIESVREQKSNPTPAELLMMQKLRFRNIAFSFQHPILTEHSFFTCDFLIPRHGLIIEIDGGCHDLPGQHKKDVVKDIVYQSMGYNVLRIKNCDVDTFNTLDVKKYHKRSIRHHTPDETPDYRMKRIRNRIRIIDFRKAQ